MKVLNALWLSIFMASLVAIIARPEDLKTPPEGKIKSQVENVQVKLSKVKGQKINGTTCRFTNAEDGSVITVKENGDVIAEEWNNHQEQIWTIVTHPTESGYFELKHETVPYNMLSGYDPSDLDPGLFPRPLNFAQQRPDDDLWHILIRNRWCLQANGRGRFLDIDDCEYYFAPWQLWKITEVQS